MARQTVIHLVDDVDGAHADETLQFELDRVTYEGDLSTANAARLRDTLAPWVASARRTGGRRSNRK
ncbi:histone-like nucleoid-structuring protein Lsr2 [Terrabacter sp. RAF57]|uniref:histone-like nucleoid-structuring protein Lsr2 n=1 Tax=Terrabacter sp. RAF57 TaxID=3233063 RepID=UPI003F94CCB2